MDELLSVTQAAKELDVLPDTVRRAAQQGRIKATKVGPRAWVIRREDLEEYRARRQGGGKTGPKRRTPT